ncbi:MAG: class I SAM-dependent methyltransferase [archaeon]|nr:class I SAM-dependent methyltransferase [archaeon]
MDDEICARYGEQAKAVCDEWQKEAHRHPAFGEGKGSDYMATVWDGAAETYSDWNYSQIKSSIIDNLYYRGILRPDSTVLDIGCGPGTYAKPISRMCRSVLCLDSSPGMLSRLRRECEEESIRNVSTVWADCCDIPPECRMDVAFCSLCPPMNNPESVLSLEDCANEWCVYISSSNAVGSLETEIWNALGKDYSYGGSNTQYPYDFLRAIGRDATLDFFSEEYESSRPTDQVVEMFISKFSKYRNLDFGMRRTIEKTVRRHDVDGMVVQKNTMRMGLLVWKPMGN